MKNFTLAMASAALLLGASTPVNAENNRLEMQKVVQTLCKRFAHGAKPVRLISADNDPEGLLRQSARRSETGAIWCPAHDVIYDYKNNVWVDTAEDYFTYDKRGNILTDIQTDNSSQWLKIVYTYNAKNQLVERHYYSSEDGTNYSDYVRNTYTYDDVTGMQLSNVMDRYDASSNSWKPYTGTKVEITRNANGYIEQVSDFSRSYTSTTWTETNRVTFAYVAGSAAPVSAEAFEANYSGTLESAGKFSDMVWTRCNGQLTDGFGPSWATDDNALKSATATYTDGTNKQVVKISGTVKGADDYQFVLTDETDKSFISVYSSETIDENGSVKYGAYAYYNQNNGDAEVTPSQLYYSQYQQDDYNSHGDMTQTASWQSPNYGEDAVLYSGTKYDYEYNGAHGEMTQMIQNTFDTTTNAFQPIVKYTYDTFVDVTTNAIKHIGQDDANGKTEVYDIRGMKVADNTDGLHGVYIIKENGRTVKRSL